MWHSTSAHVGETIWESPDPAFVVGLDGRISAWNNAAEILFAIAAGDALGRSCASVVRGYGSEGEPVCSDHCPALRKARLGGSAAVQDMTVKGAARPSPRVTVRVHHLTVTNSTGTPSGILHLISEDRPDQRPPGAYFG